MSSDRNFSSLADIPELELLRQIVHAVGEGIILLNDRQAIEFCNPAAEALFGLSSDQIIGRQATDFVDSSDRILMLERFAQRRQGINPGASFRYRIFNQRLGRYVPVDARMTEFVISDKKFGLLGTLVDASENEQMLDKIRASEAEFRQILNGMADTFYRTDAEGKIIFISPSVFSLLGYLPAELIGKPLASFYVDPNDRDRTLRELELGHGSARSVEAQLLHRDGHSVWVSTNAFYRYDENGRPAGVEGVSRDISESKRVEVDLRRMALTDPMTGLYNRAALLEAIDKAIEAANESGDEFALLFVDLDNLKQINDQLGHSVGDDVICAVGNRLSSAVRGDDMVARIGGDEFVILLPLAPSLESPQERADAVTQIIASPYRANIPVSASVGHAVYPRDGQTADALIDSADKAMYEVKRRSKARVRTIGP